MLLPDWRSPEERYGLYIIRDGELRLLATCGTPAGIGVALVTMAEEGELEITDGFGVLDSHGDPSSPGTWLISPWAAPYLK